MPCLEAVESEALIFTKVDIIVSGVSVCAG